MLSTHFEELPKLPPATPYLLVAMLACFWLAMRVIILRRQRLRRPGEEDSVPEWRWLHALAVKTWILPALMVLAGLLAVAVVLTFVL